MRNSLSRINISKTAEKSFEISDFKGFNRTELADGSLLDAENMTVLSGGALCSVLKEKKVDVSASMPDIVGVYSYNEDCDAKYEKQVTADWVFEHICPARVLDYIPIDTVASRIMIKDAGYPAKKNGGYRNVICAFTDGESTFVFYDAYYYMIDERRNYEFEAIGDGYMWTYWSGGESEKSDIRVYFLSQIFMDVISKDGIKTSLVDAKLELLKKVTDSRYKYSRMVGFDIENFEYLTYENAPMLGVSYTIYIDKVYNELYPKIDTAFGKGKIVSMTPKRMVRYVNILTNDKTFTSEGEKVLLLPDRRLLLQNNGKWCFSDEVCETVPSLTVAVQHFDRLYGILGNTVYVSSKGDCTNFAIPTGEALPSAAWKMVTTDVSGFTAIAAVAGKVVVFTSKSMLTIKGTELPFSLSFVADCGCFSQDALAVVEGMLYFVSRKGILCYNGSSIRVISNGLPHGTDYSKATVCESNGVLVVMFGDSGEVWFYEPSSEEWSRLSLSGDQIMLTGGNAIVKSGKSYGFYRLFDEFGDFSFTLGTKNRGRRKIKSISVTASIGEDSEICICDKDGQTLMEIGESGEAVSTYCYFPKGMYADHGEFYFSGYGDVTVYGVRIEYIDVKNKVRAI